MDAETMARHDEIEKGVRGLAAFAALSFLVVGAAFYLHPEAVAREVTVLGREFGSFAEPPSPGFRFWLGLTAAYMGVVTALAAAVAWDPRRFRGLLPFLAIGKATSSLTSLHLYLTDAPVFVFALNFVLDGSIAMACLGCYAALLLSAFSRGEDLFPAAPDPLDGTRAHRTLVALVDALLPAHAGGHPAAGAARFRAFLAGQHPAAPRLAALGLLALEWAPLLRLEASRPFSRLLPGPRRKVLTSLAGSRLAPLRQLHQNLRFLVLTVVLSAPDTARDLGYPGPEPHPEVES